MGVRAGRGGGQRAVGGGDGGELEKRGLVGFAAGGPERRKPVEAGRGNARAVSMSVQQDYACCAMNDRARSHNRGGDVFAFLSY